MPEDAHPPMTCGSPHVAPYCLPSHQSVAAHSTWQGSSAFRFGRDHGAAGRLLVWNQCWHFCVFDKSWARIFLFKSLPVLSHILHILIVFRFISISGLFFFFLLANPQANFLVINHSFLQTPKLGEAAYNW